MTQLLDTAADEIANADATTFDKETIRKVISELLWNWYYTNSELVIHTIRIPIKWWKFSHTVVYAIKVSDTKKLFELIAGPEA